MVYFAYGSNMNWQQMQGRCPSARFVSVAVLADHQIAFTRESVTRGCGVADAVRAPGEEMWGVLYEISDRDVSSLDRSEGYRPGREKNSYWRRGCVVFPGGDRTQPLTVSTYFGEPQPNPPLPNAKYRQLIVSGARHWHLPAEYVQDLEAIEVSG
jgi:gamma-glutamylcyclotransferase